MHVKMCVCGVGDWFYRYTVAIRKCNYIFTCCFFFSRIAKYTVCPGLYGRKCARADKCICLQVRLADLARGFEEATIDKNNQDEKTIKMDKMLETAARLRKVSMHMN